MALFLDRGGFQPRIAFGALTQGREIDRMNKEASERFTMPMEAAMKINEEKRRRQQAIMDAAMGCTNSGPIQPQAAHPGLGPEHRSPGFPIPGSIPGRRPYMAGVGRFLAEARLAERLQGEHPYGYAMNNPATYTDPTGLQPRSGGSGLPGLGTCRSRGGKACFHCAYKVFAVGHHDCPKAACENANRLCGTNVRCGPCGMCPDPRVPSNCLDFGSLNKFGEFLRGSGASAGGGSDCSKSCGGYGQGDKLAHCFKGCVIACVGPVAICAWRWGGLKDSESDDADAEAIGISLGLTSLTLQSCFKKCGDAVSGMECY